MRLHLIQIKMDTGISAHLQQGVPGVFIILTYITIPFQGIQD